MKKIVYVKGLRFLKNYFPKNKILIIESEKLLSNLEETLFEIANFLNISPEGFTCNLNIIKYKKNVFKGFF